MGRGEERPCGGETESCFTTPMTKLHGQCQQRTVPWLALGHLILVVLLLKTRTSSFTTKKTRIEVPITEQSMEYLHSKPSPRKDIRNKVGDTLKP